MCATRHLRTSRSLNLAAARLTKALQAHQRTITQRRLLHLVVLAAIHHLQVARHLTTLLLLLEAHLLQKSAMASIVVGPLQAHLLRPSAMVKTVVATLLASLLLHLTLMRTNAQSWKTDSLSAPR